jgi:hypothetical protein
MFESILSRRRFLVSGLRAAFFGCGLLLSACDSKKKGQEKKPQTTGVERCDDLSALSETEAALRTKFGYVTKSPIAENQCKNCNLFLPPKADRVCGSCMLFKGPVLPDAYCTYWAPRV